MFGHRRLAQLGFALLALGLAAAGLAARGLTGAGSALAQSYPPGFNDQAVVTGLNVPTTILFTPDGRILIGEQGGTVRVFQNGQLLAQPMLTLTVESTDEQGILGMTLDPLWPAQPYLYVCYTPYLGHHENNFNQVSRFTVTGNVANPASEFVVLGGVPTGLGYHVGGCIRFGTDGTLFMSAGDTGWSPPYPQDLTRLEGKLLRVNRDGTIPASNPFVSTPGARREIYQWGLRNPFRFSIHPTTGKPWIGDVGLDWVEEVDVGPPGANFGWPIYEGPAVPANPAYVDPVYSYDHSLGSAAIVGNLFYSGTQFPAEYQGNFFFFDHSRGHLGRLVLNVAGQVISATNTWAITASSGWLSGPVDLVQGNDGALYYCTFSPGEIRRIFYTGAGNRNPNAVATAAPTAGSAPLIVQFDGAGSYDLDNDPLTYEWSFGDGAPLSAAVSPLHVYAAGGTFAARLIVRDNHGGADTTAFIAITVGNQPPVLTINTPPNGTNFIVGQTVTFSGSGSDPETGSLPGSALHWKVDLHHLNHIHPVLPDLVGPSGSFVAQSHGEDLSTIWYRITLWADDPVGLRGETAIDVVPYPGQPGPVTRTYTIEANDRDAVSVGSQVRLSGYSPGELFDYVSTDAEQESAGLEFAVDIPRGSTILSAVLIVRAGPIQNNSATGSLRVQRYAVANAAPFVAGAFGDLVNHQPVYAPSVLWPVGSAWVSGADYTTPELASLVQSFVDDSGYTPGSYLGFVVTEGTIPANRYYGWADYAAGAPISRLRVVYQPPVTAVPEPAVEPGPRLANPAPNPFRSSVAVDFALPAAGPVRAVVYDVRGRQVRVLQDRALPAGSHHLEWDGRDAGGIDLPSGIYWVKLNTATGTDQVRVVRQK